MKKIWLGLLGTAATVGLVLGIVGCSKKSASVGSGRITIVVIPKGTTHAYWQSVKAGAENAGRELGVDIIFKGPLREDDVAGQQNLVDGFVSDKVSGIVLAPLSDAALVRPVQNATASKIPVVIIDSALKANVGSDFVSFIATNNRLGGQMAGDELTRILGGKGKLVLLRYASFSASTNEREAGFLESIKKSPGFTMLVDNRYAGATEAEATNEAQNMLDQLRQADGIFCPNESVTLGMLHVLEQNNLAGKVHFVGFDATPRELDGLKKGEIDALVSQNPVNMGYLGVKACYDAIQGKKVDQSIDSGVKLITRDNMDTPEIRKFLNLSDTTSAPSAATNP